MHRATGAEIAPRARKALGRLDKTLLIFAADGSFRMEYAKPKRWELWALVPLLTGLYWLTDGHPHWLLVAVLPGTLLLAAAVSLLLWPGDARINEYVALGGALGVLLAIPAMWVGGFGAGLLAGLLSAASYLAAGRMGLAAQPRVPGVPAPEPSLVLSAKAALDEALVAYFVTGARIPAGDEAQAQCDDAHRLEQLLGVIGADRDPAALHAHPSAPEAVQIDTARLFGWRYERLRYASGFTADPRLPGATAWASYRANQTCEAQLLRHVERGRPWLLCIHGYRMGPAWMNLPMFDPGWLHHGLGLNLLIPALPLHGARSIGLRSGDGYMDGNLLDLVLAQCQALWDLRRAIAWIRAQEPEARIGVFGVSLGGYNAALLAGYERALDFVVAGIPLVDCAGVLWRHLPAPLRDYLTHHDFDEARYRRLLQPVSPLALPPQPAQERRSIFAATADRVLAPTHAAALAAHWNVPVSWYDGGHLTFRGERAVKAAIETPMLRAGWALGNDSGKE